MALSLLITTPDLTLSTNNNIIVVSDSNTAVKYFICNLYINDVLVNTFNIYVNSLHNAYIYLDDIFNQYFDYYLYALPTSLFTNLSDLVKYKFVITSDVTATPLDTGNKYFKKGVVQDFETFNYADYMMITGSTKHNFLTNQTSRIVNLNDSKTYIDVITGKVGTPTSTITGLFIKSYYSDGTTYTHKTYDYVQSFGITRVDISPSRLNLEHTNLITANTLYYDVWTHADNSGLHLNPITYSNSNPIRIYISNNKLNNNFNILYVNSYGSLDSMLFSLNYEQNLKYKIDSYTNNNQNRLFNKIASQEFEVYSDWISEEQSLQLTDLWNSPRAWLYRNNKLIEIIINNNNVKVLHRRNQKLINYQLNFKYANNYKTVI